jgi:hypothetical protein
MWFWVSLLGSRWDREPEVEGGDASRGARRVELRDQFQFQVELAAASATFQFQVELAAASAMFQFQVELAAASAMFQFQVEFAVFVMMWFLSRWAPSARS